MATYRAIASSETDPDAPVTSELMAALAANPLAIAEGAGGAPKVVSKSFGIVFAVTETVPFSVTDLDDESNIAIFIDLDVQGDGTSAVCEFEISLSDDNGATWGSFFSVFTVFVETSTPVTWLGVKIRALFANNAIRFRTRVSTGTVTSLSATASVVGFGAVVS